MQPAHALDDGREERISFLLTEISDARSRLDQALERFRLQRERLEANHLRTKHLFQFISELRELEFPDLPARPKPPVLEHGLYRLTTREREIVVMIAQGLSTKQIAAKLNISFKTVVCHRSHILEKLNCHESATLVRLAFQAGLVA